MDRAELLQGIRKMRFEALLDRHERGAPGSGKRPKRLGCRSGRSAAGGILAIALSGERRGGILQTYGQFDGGEQRRGAADRGEPRRIAAA
jgi:hypothetical protein